jgi:probable F420-dependent oxidoreductase
VPHRTYRTNAWSGKFAQPYKALRAAVKSHDQTARDPLHLTQQSVRLFGMTSATPPRWVLMLPVGGEFGAHPRSLVDLAQRAEAAGFAAVSLSEHVVMGPRVDRYPWGKFPFPPEDPWVEPLTVLTAVAATTERIGLTTAVLIAPLRPAALLAKWVATVDQIASGRLVLGVGTGWQQEEFAAAGVDYAARGRVLNDTIAACRALWKSTPASFASQTVSFDELYCEPKPTRPGGPEILFAGTLSERALQRIVSLGDGWIPIMGERREGIASGAVALREAFAVAGRDPDALRIRSTVRVRLDPAGRPDIGATLHGASALLEAGVTDPALPLSAFVHGPADVAGFFERAAVALAELEVAA